MRLWVKNKVERKQTTIGQILRGEWRKGGKRNRQLLILYQVSKSSTGSNEPHKSAVVTTQQRELDQ